MGSEMCIRDSYRVLHTKHPTSRERAAPETEYKWLGLFSRKHTPRLWNEEALEFRESFCLPPAERLSGYDYNWEDYDLGDLYLRRTESMTGFFQIGGLPSPIQYDDMEQNCAKRYGETDATSWRLLLQIDSGGDMMWGDSGRLYWFIRQDDLDALDFSNVHLEMQCH